MEKELNIAAILKDKPKGTKLWSFIVGKCTFSGISSKNGAIMASFVDKDGELSDLDFNEYGKTLSAPKEAEVCLFPSKSMGDWSKFAWKRGDVLISDCGFVCIFKEWASDDYTKFNGCYFDGMPNAETAKYSKLDNNTAYGYIREIENRCGGKLNLETLEIEKQPEFKDGDIITLEGCLKATVILQNLNINRVAYYVYYSDAHKLDYVNWISLSDRQPRPATDSEKQQLFDALAKEGKRWNPETKTLDDLPKKCEFKTFDKVLVRNSKDDTWEADFFARLTRKEIDYTQSGKYLCVGDLWMYCIPYNEETAHLLGTTDEWKGGEG